MSPRFDDSADLPNAPDPAPPEEEWEEVEELVELELVDPEDAHVASQGGISGTVSSIVFHGWLILTLAGMSYNQAKPSINDTLETTMELTEETPEEEEEIDFTLANPEDRELEVREVVQARSVGRIKTKKPQIQSPPEPIRELSVDAADPDIYDIPEGQEIDEHVVIKGTTGEGLVEIESALDRVTWEVANNLKESKVLLIWMLDASGSLIKQREIVAKRLNRIYGELDALGEAGEIPRHQEPLLTGVVSYGLKTTFHTKDPTADFSKVLEAVENVEIDVSGRENIFAAVTEVVGKWSGYKRSQGRRIMVVAVTDESGDDFNMLEPAIRRCRVNGAKMYIVGPPAVFGRREGYVNYEAPEDGQTYQLAVDVGPETPMIANVDLPFWYNGPKYKYVSSGFGPYGLARLVRETGGVYFMTNTLTTETLTPVGVYDGDNLKPFEPEYDFATPEEYLRNIASHPLRAAIFRAADMNSQMTIRGMPTMEFRVTAQNFRQTATDAQQRVANDELMIDNLLSAFPPDLERAYDLETSARWRMTYCLLYGRLLAQKVRLQEYNMACADLKGGLNEGDINSTANHWIFRPSAQLNHALSAKRYQKKATQLLQRVIDEAPGTPWALMAARELKDPLGIQVVKRFIPPPPEPERGNANNNGRRGVRLAPDPRPNTPTPNRPQPPPRPKPVLPKL